MAGKAEIEDGAGQGIDKPYAAGAFPEGLSPEMFTPWGMLGLADELPVMVGYFDRELRYRFLNKALADWLELPRSEILGRTAAEITGDAAFLEREPLIRAALAGERQAVSTTFDHPTRGQLALQSEYIPWRDASGEVQGFIAVSTDVTEQRAAEQALRESEARFRRIADSAPVLMWVTRLDRSRDFVNEAYADFVGLPAAEAGMFDWRTRIHPEDIGRVIDESLAGEASLAPFALEGRYMRHDGEYRWLRSVSSPRFNADGSLAGFIGVASDITLAKQAEIELKAQVEERTALLSQSEARFRAIFDTVLEVLVLLDTDGTIIELNRKEAIWRDPDADKALGQKIWDAPTMQAYPQHIPMMKRAIKQAAKGKLFNEEVTMDRDGVPTAYLDISVQPVRDARGNDHLSAVRSARHHRPQGRAGAASPEPENGSARPAHRRHRARLQQSADGGRRRARYRRQARRGREAQALCDSMHCRPPSAARG